MSFYITLILIFVYIVNSSRYCSNNSITYSLSLYKDYSLFYNGVGGMSNIILGYYSYAYLSLLMNRFYKVNDLNFKIINLYYHIPKIFLIKNSSSNYIYVKKISLKIFNRFKSEKIIRLSSCHDILEFCVYLCNRNLLVCKFINSKSNNIVHEIYKLRKKLLNELLPPRKSLKSIYNNFKNKNVGLIVGVHIRTAIYSDFHEKDYRFYNNNTEKLYNAAIKYVINKLKYNIFSLYIISDSSKIKREFNKEYSKYKSFSLIENITISHSVNKYSLIEQYILSECDIIIGSCSSTYTLLSVFRYLKEYYAIEGLKYSIRGKIKGKCNYELDFNHHLITI